MVQSVLLNFIYVDILITEMWLPQLIFSTNTRFLSQDGLNLCFEENGFSSKLLVSNLGSSFVYLLIYLLLCALSLSTSFLSKYLSM
jgi:hypothetical protein